MTRAGGKYIVGLDARLSCQVLVADTVPDDTATHFCRTRNSYIHAFWVREVRYQERHVGADTVGVCRASGECRNFF